MHCPKVRPRTATPVETTATSVMPGMACTAATFCTETTVPLIVGGRQIIAGIAPATLTSIANCLRPVTASRASIRFCGVPMTLKADAALRVTEI